MFLEGSKLCGVSLGCRSGRGKAGVVAGASGGEAAIKPNILTADFAGILKSLASGSRV